MALGRVLLALDPLMGRVFLIYCAWSPGSLISARFFGRIFPISCVQSAVWKSLIDVWSLGRVLRALDPFGESFLFVSLFEWALTPTTPSQESWTQWWAFNPLTIWFRSFSDSRWLHEVIWHRLSFYWWLVNFLAPRVVARSFQITHNFFKEVKPIHRNWENIFYILFVVPAP